MNIRIWLLAAATAAIFAAGAEADEINPAAEYDSCMKQTKSAPNEAFEKAMSWRDMGGGAPAKHCVAAALMALGQYSTAAARFEELAQEIIDKPSFKAELLGQASQAWLMDNKAERAEGAATAGLKINPMNQNLLVDRAVIRAAAGRYKEAVEDLNLAVEMNPDSVEALVFRASAQRLLDNLEQAETDVNLALSLDPLHPEGLLERGNIRRLKGDDDGARADWLQVLGAHPDTLAAQAAQANLEKMDVKTE
ncbi:MAG: hypothetical protein A3G18_12015 [Rhodospirillales bacterium RIFCSPLOWO2_12_FULL_58_28]|nr:MAG: hypothetical protein A3H92_09100 [Rhodospirillales bacterium RIFCSPLOWO2_02_FULL_58_16]OHC78167.1 MAG: hypothetical protein A3G18_12015 [Rhodospirillales bacterium RIFCSPLOWO2_12_FULL_58_28]